MGRSGFASVSPQFPRSDVQVYQPCRYGTIPQKADIPEGIGANSKVDAMYYPVKYERPNLGLGHSSCRSIRCCSIQSSTAASHCNPRGRMVTKYYITLFLLSATTVIELYFAQRVKRRPETSQIFGLVQQTGARQKERLKDQIVESINYAYAEGVDNRELPV
jgi:hypothetical protein